MIGDPLAPATDIGTPRRRASGRDECESTFQVGVDEGATNALSAARRPTRRSFSAGCFVAPVVFGNVTRADANRARGDLRTRGEL